MLATLKQPTTAQVGTTQLPTVTYDRKSLTINATVIISPGDEPNTYHHHVPAISVPGPTGATWTVIWTLVPSDVGSVNFGIKGVVIPKPGTRKPDEVGLPDSLPGSLPGQRRLTNNVLDVNVVRYDLDLDVRDFNNDPLTRSQSIIVDPAIAIVKDPIDG